MTYDYQTPLPRRETSKLRRFAGQIGRGLLIGGGVLGALGVLGTLANSRYDYAERGIETGSESLHSDNPQKNDAHQDDGSEQITVAPTRRKPNVRTLANQLVDEIRGGQSPVTGSDTGLSGTGTLVYSPTEAWEPGSHAVRRSQLTPDMRLQAQFYNKGTKETENDPSKWTENTHGSEWNLSTDDYMNPGESREEYTARNRAKAQLGEFIADRMLGTQDKVAIKRGPTIEDGISYGEDNRGELQGKQSMGGLINVVLDETRQAPNKLYNFAKEQLIKTADPATYHARREYDDPTGPWSGRGKRNTKAAQKLKKSIEAKEATYIPKHGRGAITSEPPLDRSTVLVDLKGWDEEEPSGGNPDTAVRMAEGYKKAKEKGLIPDDAQD